MIKWMWAVWSLVPLPLQNPAWTSKSSQFMYLWNLAWRTLSIALLACEMCTRVVIWAFFGISFLWHWIKTDLFQSCGHCWVFQICWHFESSIFTASLSRIWNSSTGTSLPPLPLFILMLSKAHLTSNSNMSGSRRVITPSWLSGSVRSF